MEKIPRILIAAPTSGSGKTTVVCALLQALKDRGMNLRAFKCGPDYIDPMFHSRVIGVPSRNLDAFLMGFPALQYLFSQNSRGADFALLEGAMGYYDGIAGGEQASAYHLAKITQTPVLLIVDCKAAALSIAALIQGFLQFRNDSQIVGVILNRVSKTRYPVFKQLIERESSVEVLGYLPYLKDCTIESRHLGLMTAQEIAGLEQKLAQLSEQAEQSIDLDRLLQLGEQAVAWKQLDFTLPSLPQDCKNLRIAYAKDAAFCFYYQDNLELLQQMGAELLPFSPISDSNFPENIHGLLLGGGYPELYAESLSENQKIQQQIARQILDGMPCIAECGGFLYLHRSLRVEGGNSHSMVGIIDAEGYPTGKLRRFGYITLTANSPGNFWEAGESIPAHEFHYWDSTDPGAAFLAEKPVSGQNWTAGHCKGNLLAGFPHLHFYGNLRLAERFLQKAAEYRSSQKKGESM